MALKTDMDRLTFLLEAEAELALFGDEQLSAQAAEEQRRYVTNYIGSKQKLIDFIWENTPDDTRAVADLFSGSSVVGFMFKQKGKEVTANDRLRYCFHIARAIIENPGETITDDEIAALLADNPAAGDFVRKHFAGIYFAEGVHGIIDSIRANIDKLPADGFKRDIALFALGKSCITGKGGFGHFGTTIPHGDRQDNPERFKQRFADNVHTINGFEVTLGTDPPQTTITIRRGVLVTDDYCRIEETEPIIDALPIPPNETANPRWDLVVCEHRYLRSVPPPVAMYAIIQGEASPTPSLPDIAENCVPLAYCRIPGGASQYAEIVNFITHFRYNCFWDDAADTWRIRFGAKIAMLISIMPTPFSALNLSSGMRVFIHPGGVADGDPVTWTRIAELTPDGFTELVTLAQEVIAARGSRASLDDRLDQSLNEDGSYKRVGILDQVMDEVEQARGSAASLDVRLDVSLNNDGTYRRVGLLDQVMDEVEDARGSMSDLDARLDVSLNNDGTIKTTALQEKITHADLTNMPDTGGTNGDHDARYYRQTEINDIRDRIHGDGVLTGCDVLSVNGMSLHIAAGTVLLNGKLVTVQDHWSDSMETEGTWYCSINSLGNSIMSQSGWNGVHLYKCRVTASDVEVVSDKRDMISLPDRRNIFRHAQDFYDPGVTMLGGVSLAWEGVLAIGKVAGCGTTTYDGQTRGYCRMVDATFAAVFEPGMIVTFWNLSEAATYKRVVHAVNADCVYFTTSTSVGANSSGTLAEYRKIDGSADFRDRILTVLSTSRYSLYNDPNFMPNGNDKGTWGATAGATAYGNFRMNVSQVYTELGIDFSESGWSDQETGSSAAMVYVPGGSQDSGSQGWRILADDYDGELWIAYAHATWDGIFDVSTYKGGRANFYVMILASPDLGGYV